MSMDPLLKVLILNAVIPAAGLLLARQLYRHPLVHPVRGVVAWLGPALLMAMALAALAWTTAPDESYWLGEKQALAREDSIRWSVFLHAGVCWPGFVLYFALVALRLPGWREAEGGNSSAVANGQHPRS